MMSYNAGMAIDHPGYDPATGCIAWLPSEWDTFEARLALPASRQGYFYVEEVGGGFLGHAHYRVDDALAAHVGINVIPERRGSGLSLQFLRLVCDRVRADTHACEIVNEFEDSRVAACRTHLRCGFVPDAALTDSGTRIWRSPVVVAMAGLPGPPRDHSPATVEIVAHSVSNTTSAGDRRNRRSAAGPISTASGE